jgi:plastocyanin
MMKGRFDCVLALIFREERDHMRLRDVRVQVLGVSLSVLLAACGGGSQESSTTTTAPPPAPGAQKVDPATAADLKGTVTLNGAAPKNEPIRMNADPVCLKEATGPQFQETIMASADGKLANVFVYVKDGLGNYAYDPPAGGTKLDQDGCRYKPHVFGVRVGQPIEIVNSDPTLHNIHAMPKANPEFNNGQPIQGMKMTHSFKAKEVMVPFKCDVHGWMNAYVGVLDHPFFAVTKEDGSFEMKGLPPGTYTIEAWHEKLGAMTQSVTVAAKESKEVSFTFDAAKAAD